MANTIREFDLDAPSLSKVARSDFRYQTRSLTSLYERCFDWQLSIGKAWKILVEVVPAVTHVRHRNLLGVLVVQIQGDPDSFLHLVDDHEKEECALNWLIQGLLKLSQELDLDREGFIKAADKVRELDYQNVRSWLKPRPSPEGILKADVVVDHRIHEARIIGRILDTEGMVLSEHFLIAEKPDEFMFAPILGSLHWIDSKTVELRSKDRLNHWRFEVARKQ